MRVILRDSKGGTRDERCGLKFDGWLELKGCENPRQTYLNHYRPKPINYLRSDGTFMSPAAQRRTPAEIAESRRREEANRPMGCGMKLFLLWLGASGLTVLALFVAEQIKRQVIIIK